MGDSLLLDVDPDLADGVGEAEWDSARTACAGTVVEVPPGRWGPHDGRSGGTDAVGFLIVDGLIAREVSLRDRHMLELLGARDVVHPPMPAEWPNLGRGTTLTAITHCSVAVLGPRFIRAAGRWPELLGAVGRRLEEQRKRLAIQGLIAHLPRAEDRLLLQLWHLAARWGQVTASGVVIPWELTHDLLAQLIGARRPTVTLAVRSLEEDGCVSRAADGGWLLTPVAERRVRAISRPQSEDVETLGELLMVRQRSAQIRSESKALVAQSRQAKAAWERRRAGGGAGIRRG